MTVFVKADLVTVFVKADLVTVFVKADLVIVFVKADLVTVFVKADAKCGNDSEADVKREIGSEADAKREIDSKAYICGQYIALTAEIMNDTLMNSTIDFYNNNADSYYEQTAGVDFSDLYERFLEYVPEGGRIMDVGCGSGRDAGAFCRMGFRAEGLDAAEGLVALAREKQGIDVTVCNMEDWITDKPYDGIWCCAVLVHLEDEQIKKFFNNLRYNLAEGGVLFVSVKIRAVLGIETEAGTEIGNKLGSEDRNYMGTGTGNRNETGTKAEIMAEECADTEIGNETGTKAEIMAEDCADTENEKETISMAETMHEDCAGYDSKGRYMRYFERAELRKFVEEACISCGDSDGAGGQLKILEEWESEDGMDRDVRWLNLIIRRQ